MTEMNIEKCFAEYEEVHNEKIMNFLKENFIDWASDPEDERYKVSNIILDNLVSYDSIRLQELSTAMEQGYITDENYRAVRKIILPGVEDKKFQAVLRHIVDEIAMVQKFILGLDREDKIATGESDNEEYGAFAVGFRDFDGKGDSAK